MSTLNNKFVILTAFYNAEDYIGRNVDHTLKQSYDDLGIIFINDASTDDTKDVLFNRITGTYNGNINQSESSNIWTGEALGKNIIYVENSDNVGSAGFNQKVAVDNYISNPNTICGIVDGDDFLNDNEAVSWVTNKMGSNYLMYASTQRWKAEVDHPLDGFYFSNKPLTQDDFPDGFVAPPLRCQGWHFHHFRAFKKVLSDNVVTGRSFINPTGGFIKEASDVAYFKPMIDMAGADRIHISKTCHYTYTFDSSINDHTQNPDEQNRNSKFCCFAVTGVGFISGDENLSGFCTEYNLLPKYVTGNNANLSGVVDGQTGYFLFDRTSPVSPDGTTTCATPYDRLIL
jgi:glycosyltransferase involved in cell wall biosynthesis